MLTNHEDVKKKLKEHFEKLLNEAYVRESVESIPWNKVLIG